MAQSTRTPWLLEQAQQAEAQLAEGGQPIPRILTRGLAALKQAQQKTDQALAELGPTGGPLTKSERRRLGVLQTRILFARGELYRQAAAVTAVKDPTRRAYLDIALAVFEELQSHPLGRLGRAKTYRLMGKMDLARQALEPLTLLVGKPSKTQLALWRMAMVEQLNEMLADASDEAASLVMAQAAALLKHRHIQDDPPTKQAVQWVHAQASVQTATSFSQIAAAEKSLRLANPPRGALLNQLARLQEVSSEPVMSREELDDWVVLLASEALPTQVVQRIERVASAPFALGPLAVSAYGAALWQSGQRAKAVHAMDLALAKMDQSDPKHALVSQWRASCLYESAMQQNSLALARQAKEALASVVEGDLAEAVRIAALGQWVALEQQQGHAAAAVDQLLQRYPKLVAADPYLRYVRIARQWQQFKTLAIKGSAATETAQRALSQLESLVPEAVDKKQLSIAGHAKLLQARIYASSPLNDPTRALEALGIAQQRFKQTDVRAFELALLVQTDALPKAIKRFESTPITERTAEGWVLLARACAFDKTQRQRAIAYSRQAWRFALTPAQRAGLAQTLVSIGASEVLVDLIGQGKVAGTGALMLSVGQAMLAVQKRGRAVQWLTAASAKLPESLLAALTLGDALTGLHQQTEAVEAYRIARQRGRPGEVDWWRATLGLCRSLVVLHHKAAARDILRVAKTLYPNIADPLLYDAAEQLDERLSQP